MIDVSIIQCSGNGYNSFNNIDERLILGTNYSDRIRKLWKNVPVNFNIKILLNSNNRYLERYRQNEIGLVSFTWLRDNLTTSDTELNAVNFYITKNMANKDDWYPLTPWMLAHKFAHGTAFDHGRMGLYTNDFRNPWVVALKIYSDYIRYINVYNPKEGTSYEFYKSFFETVLTTKSARTGNIKAATSLGESYLEMLVQYMITGSITFNSVPLITKYSNVILSETEVNILNNRLKQLTDRLEVLFLKALHYSVGKVFVA